ncbi:hypothetical protein Hanom_Chr07g00600301 [Helianthus anomalus]
MTITRLIIIAITKTIFINTCHTDLNTKKPDPPMYRLTRDSFNRLENGQAPVIFSILSNIIFKLILMV